MGLGYSASGGRAAGFNDMARSLSILDRPTVHKHEKHYYGQVLEVSAEEHGRVFLALEH
jgi:hypothetical protein